MRAWLDDELWREAGGAEFRHAQAPDQWLDPAPGSIWAGFMLPDTLPIISNDYGDWLCLRIAADGLVSELVQWSHGGGDWIPCGRSLAEALLYDAAAWICHPPRDDVPWDVDAPPRDMATVFRLAGWARDVLARGGGDVPCFWRDAGGADRVCRAGAVLAQLLQAGMAEFAVRRDRLLRWLDSPLKRASGPAWARDLGVAWEPEYVSWLFDTARIPPVFRDALRQRLGEDAGDPFGQDWSAAESEALAVLARRADLGWAFDIAGWAAERRGAVDLAVARYLAGVATSWFSDDTLRFRSHWHAEGYGKFAAARLAALATRLRRQQREDPYLRIFLDCDAATLRGRVQQHWLSRAREASRRGAHHDAYQLYYRAGWDLGMLPVSAYDEVFTELAHAARAGGSPALAALASLHHRFLH
ncbi:MAG: hypothetical protein MUF48_15505 [Pirellulaceae bacterium]|nr:hypothetical protein [Pirellulaceae bacterium]